MARCLVIGDSHIPRRARDIPIEIYDKITELTISDPLDFTLFTGDQIKAPKFLDFLHSKTKNEVLIVIGNMDYFDGNRSAPLYHELDVLMGDEKLKIGLTHGAQIHPRGDHAQLELLATERNYTILISGHTHHEEIHLTGNGTLLLNPGSVTGAWSFVASRNPAFIILDLNEGSKIIRVNLLYKDKRSKEIKEEVSNFIFQNNQIQQNY